MAQFLSGVKEVQHAIWVAEAIYKHVTNRQTAYQWGHKSVAWIMACAGKSVSVDVVTQKEYLGLAKELSSEKRKDA